MLGAAGGKTKPGILEFVCHTLISKVRQYRVEFQRSHTITSFSTHSHVYFASAANGLFCPFQ